MRAARDGTRGEGVGYLDCCVQTSFGLVGNKDQQPGKTRTHTFLFFFFYFCVFSTWSERGGDKGCQMAIAKNTQNLEPILKSFIILSSLVRRVVGSFDLLTTMTYNKCLWSVRVVYAIYAIYAVRMYESEQTNGGARLLLDYL